MEPILKQFVQKMNDECDFTVTLVKCNDCEDYFITFDTDLGELSCPFCGFDDEIIEIDINA